MNRDPLVICADVGSIHAGKFGWWSSASTNGNRAGLLADHVAESLNAGRSVALGFECPLFVPLAIDEFDLTRARSGEGNRPWSAAAGLGAMGIGFAQVAWVLRSIRSRLDSPVPCFLDWSQFQSARVGLFIWEAFVSGKGKATSHVGDAELAARAFMHALKDPPAASLIQPNTEVFSLVGAALLRTDWTIDIAVLRQPAIVIGPRARSEPTNAGTRSSSGPACG